MQDKDTAKLPENGVITTYQFVWLLFIIITSVTSLQLPGILLKEVGHSAWISVLGGWLMDVLLAIVYAYMGIRFPGQNFSQYSVTITGKYLGSVIGIIYRSFFLLVSILTMRGLAQLLNNAFLPRTPLMVILISAYIVVAYGARKGIETLGRVTEILGPLYFLSAIIVGLFVLPNASIDRLKPQLETGIIPIFKGSVLILTFYGICVIMSSFIPLCNKPENGFLAKFSAVTLGATFAAITVILSVAVFGLVQAQNMYAPGLMLTRMINIGRFLDRVEIIWMVITVGASVLTSAILIWNFSLGITQIFGLSTYKPMVNPTVLIAIILALSFHGNTEQVIFVEKVYPPIAVVVEAGFAILLLILALILNKRGKST